MPLIDLSQTISTQMPRFSEAVPQPQIHPWLTHAQATASGRYKDCSCEITEMQFITSLGTYMDAPYHFVPEGKQIHELRLEQCILPGICIDCRPLQPEQLIGAEVLQGVEVAGKAVLLCTGWSDYWGDVLYAQYPFIGRAAADYLLEKGAKLVGVDYLAIDSQKDPYRPVHTTLLRNNILIVENLTGLDALIGKNFMFHAVPAKVAGAAAFPVRAYALLEG